MLALIGAESVRQSRTSGRSDLQAQAETLNVNCQLHIDMTDISSWEAVARVPGVDLTWFAPPLFEGNIYIDTFRVRIAKCRFYLHSYSLLLKSLPYMLTCVLTCLTSYLAAV